MDPELIHLQLPKNAKQCTPTKAQNEIKEVDKQNGVPPTVQPSLQQSPIKTPIGTSIETLTNSPPSTPPRYVPPTQHLSEFINNNPTPPSPSSTFAPQSPPDSDNLTCQVDFLWESLKERDRLLNSSASQHTNDMLAVTKRHEETLQALSTMTDKYHVLQSECEDWKRKLALAESRLKVLQLEVDRPLWEEAKRQREEKERREAEEARERKRQAEVEASARKIRELVELEKARQRELLEKKRREEAARLERERKEAAEREAQKKRDKEAKRARELAEHVRKLKWATAITREQLRCAKRDQKWRGRPWSVAFACERFGIILGEFEKLKFSEDQPLTSAAIPWPVLANPFGNHEAEPEVTWSDVETFFEAVKRWFWVEETAEYGKLVERAHRVFHPDRWRSRGLLATVMDDALRETFEAKGKIVSQALTPLWRKSKGYEG